MADVVTTTILQNGPRNLVLRLTNFSDGTGETAIKKYDAQSAVYANRGVVPGLFGRIKEVKGSVRNGGVRLQWDLAAPVDALLLGEEVEFTYDAGIPVVTGAGATGSLLLTTVGFMINSSYALTIRIIKGVPQS